MPSPDLPTKHLYHVPRQATNDLCSMADLWYAFGPRSTTSLTRQFMVAAHRLGVDLTPGPFQRPSEFQNELEQTVLDHLAQQKKHTMYVVQPSPTIEAGWVCLVPSGMEHSVQGIISRYNITVR